MRSLSFASFAGPCSISPSDVAPFRPSRCRYKVYYIDEVHQITRDAFNALLKTLEEPPEHVKFIFATTEADRVPATILSRCQRFDFRNIPTQLIAEHLRRICEAEKVTADDDALFRIARAAAGSMRDGLSLLDQLLAAGGRVGEADVVRVLGTPPDERMFAIAEAIAGGSAAGALGEFNAVLDGGVTLSAVAVALGDVFRNMMIAATCGGDSELIELPETQRKAVAELAKRFSTPALVQAVGVCQHVGRSLRGSSVARALVEAALVRLAEAEKFVDPSSLIERLEALSGGRPAAGQKKKPVAVPQAGDAPGSGGGGRLGAPSAGGGAPNARGGVADEPRQRSAGALKSSSAGASMGPSAGAPGNEADAPGGGPATSAPSLSTAEREELKKDPAVKAVTDLFGGDVVHVEIDRSRPQAADDDEDEDEADDGNGKEGD